MFPSKISEYKVVGKLGSGAFGTVNEVEVSGQRYALKIQPPYEWEFGLSGAGLIEVDTMTRLDHPNILKALHVFVDNGEGKVIGGTEVLPKVPKICYVSEKAEGDLFTIREKGISSSDWFVETLFQAFCSVEFMHSHGMIHGDIKPHNYLVFPEGKEGSLNPKGQNAVLNTLRLADFGLVQRTIAAKKFANPQIVQFRAPEIMERQKDYTTKIDIWSLGVMIYYILFNSFQLFPPDVEEKNVPQILEEELEGEDLLDAVRHIFEKAGILWMAGDLKSEEKKSQKILGDKYPLALDLMRKCLVMKPENRITAQDALSHPLFIGKIPLSPRRKQSLKGTKLKCPEGRIREINTEILEIHKVFSNVLVLEIVSESGRVLAIDLFERISWAYDLDKLDITIKEKNALAFICFFLANTFEHDVPDKRFVERILKYAKLGVSLETLECLEEIIVEDLGFCLYPENLATTLRVGTTNPLCKENLKKIVDLITNIRKKSQDTQRKYQERRYKELCVQIPS